ncbi:unnamed protein product, partial [Rotaria sp. Silwood1]
MNLTMNITQQMKITLSFRTYSNKSQLFKLIYLNEKTKIFHSIILKIINDYIHKYYLIRLDHIFSTKIILLQQIYSNNLKQLIIGIDFKGCLGNLTLNNQIIFYQQQKNNNNLIEFININNNCLSFEIIQENFHTNDFCSLYHPCYHGGICINYGLNFKCNCSKPRFTGRQCQLDLYPCESYPCQYDEKCIPLLSNSNKSFKCVAISVISLSISIKRYVLIGLIITLIICILLILIIYYYKKQKENFINDKPLVSAPLLIHKQSSITNHIESSRQRLLKLNYNETQTNETITFGENNHRNPIINYLNNR